MTARKPESKKQKVGRKSVYKPEFAQLAENYSLLGATDKEMAEYFNVNESTITRWKKQYPEFCTSIKKGKQIADSNVASKLYNRAIGYDFEEKHFEIQKASEKDKPSTFVETKRIKKHMPSDTTAAIFWLKNRQPQLWRDRKEVDATVSLGDELENMSDEQLEKLIDGEK